MVFLHFQSGYLYTIKLFQVNIYTFDHILILRLKLWQKSPPPPRMTDTWLTSYLSISVDFEKLRVFVAEKPPQLSSDI